MDTPDGHEAPSFETFKSAHLRPDAKTQRYDRQLRLWAASGQAVLEGAHVLVVNGSATATSILKNLVLPGIGQFTILDNKRVDGSDLGNNFFLQPGETQLGDYRAVEAAKYLAELNDGVKAGSTTQTVSELLNSSPEPLSPYSLVICVDAPPEETLLLSDKCWKVGVPMIAVKTCGFIGSVRTQMQEAHVIETHPDQEATLDLRLACPFPALREHALSIDFSALDSHEYAHIPPVVILLQALEQWRASHNGELPLRMADKRALRDEIGKMKRGGKNADGENFEEAVGMVMKAVKKTEIPPYIKKLMDSPQCDRITRKSAPFWVLLKSVRNFVRNPQTNEGQELLPASGVVPDMKATSTGYGRLVAIYRAKAKEDLAAVRKELSQVLLEGGLPEDGSVVSDEMLTVFVKNVAFAKVITGRKMRDEHESPDQNAIKSALDEASFLQLPTEVDEGEEQPVNVQPVHYYLALRAADLFYVEHSRWPGSSVLYDGDGEVDQGGEADFEALSACAKKVVKACTIPDDSPEPETLDGPLEMALHEICRAGRSDLPQIAALIGGIVAQEAIKIVTKQYVPLDGTHIFDGIKSASASFKF